VKHLVIVLTLLLAVSFFSAPAGADSQPTCIGQACDFALDVAGLQSKVAERINAGMKSQGIVDKEFPKENANVIKQVPFEVNGVRLVAVHLKIEPVQEGQAPVDNFLIVDPGATMIFANIRDLMTGKDLAFEAMALVKKEELPVDFGHTILEGTGDIDVVMVSDPICPYCQRAYEYFSRNMDRIKTVKLVHLPLAYHLGADTACQVIIYAEKHNISPRDAARFAYTELQAINPEGVDQNQKVKKAREEILTLFMAKFPALKESLGGDVTAALKKLEEETSEVMRKDAEMAAARNLESTPIIYVGGIRVDGFSEPQIESALSMLSE
jgi:protein-disulfide isomerase